jgi:hypothetical protein
MSVARPPTNLEELSMYYDDESGPLSFFAGLLLGAVIGASVALLSAPQPGRRTRRTIARAVAGARDVAGDRWEDISDDVRSAVEAGRKRIRI